MNSVKIHIDVTIANINLPKEKITIAAIEDHIRLATQRGEDMSKIFWAMGIYQDFEVTALTQHIS